MRKFFLCIVFLSGVVVTYAQLPAKAEDISPLLVGEVLPNATLQGVDGKSVVLSSVLKEKKTVLIFYRGGWCPYCNLHLSEIGRIEKDLLALGYQVIAVSPDAPEKLRPGMEKMEISYTLLSDKSGELTKATGLAFKAPASDKKYLIDSQGENSELFLPVPSLFILDKKGEILFEYINPNFKNRISGYLLLAAARVFALNK